jgi:hypothetical protein
MEIKIYQAVFFYEGLPRIVYGLCLEILKKRNIPIGEGLFWQKGVALSV